MRRRPTPSRALVAVVATLAGCGDAVISPGRNPPDDALFFPHGALLDPRVDASAGASCSDESDCESGQSCAAGVCRGRASWMLVTNANSDIRYNGGTIVAVDLDAWFEAVGLQGGEARVGRRGASLDADTPCRVDALDSDLVECEERYFIDESVTVHTGSFSLVPTAWNCEVETTSPVDATGTRPRHVSRHCADDEARIFVPVNGDPSIVWATLSGGGPGQAPSLDCGQGSENDPLRCGDDHRLRFLRDDESSLPLAREMTNMLVSPDRRFPVAYVAHDTQGIGIPGLLTMLRLDGLSGVDEPGDPADPVSTDPPTLTTVDDPLPPSIVDIGALYQGAGAGGFGLAQRPCDRSDAPVVTNGCSAPLVYATYRLGAGQTQVPLLATFTARRLRPSDLIAGQVCDGPDAADDDDVVVCDESLQAESIISIDGGAARVGEIHIGRDGETLYAVTSAAGGAGATGPSALVRMRIGFDVFGEPIAETINAFAEVCDRASALAIYDDGIDEFGLVSCFRTAQVFIVDLRTMSVVATALAGAGAHRMTVDLAREVVYVANTLDATLSAIDMSRARSNRFRTFARLGLSEPFSQ